MTLTPWIRIGQPLEAVMSDYERIFDAWEQGGIRGLVFGRLVFADEQGQSTIPAFKGDPAPYQKRGLNAQLRDVPLQPDKEKLLHAMLADAKRRGWTVMIFAPASGTIAAEGLPLEEDPYGTQAHAASWEDIFAAFPEADGGIVDGWTESPYELTYHHGNAVFRPLNDGQRREATARGYDAERLDRGRQHLHQRFQSFTPAEVDYYGDYGVLSEMNLFDINEDALYWLRWRREDGIRQGREFRQAIDELPRQLLLGNGPRSAVFSGMTALDFHAWGQIVDLLLVKHYFWHRGFDGMYGTVARWVQQIQEWNPVLSESAVLDGAPRLARHPPARGGVSSRHGVGISAGVFRRGGAGRDAPRHRRSRRPAKDPALGRYRAHAPRRRPHDLRRSLPHPPSLGSGRATALPLPQSRPPNRSRMGGYLADVRHGVGRRSRRLLASGDA